MARAKRRPKPGKIRHVQRAGGDRWLVPYVDLAGRERTATFFTQSGAEDWRLGYLRALDRGEGAQFLAAWQAEGSPRAPVVADGAPEYLHEMFAAYFEAREPTGVQADDVGRLAQETFDSYLSIYNHWMLPRINQAIAAGPAISPQRLRPAQAGI